MSQAKIGLNEISGSLVALDDVENVSYVLSGHWIKRAKYMRINSKISMVSH